jgi:hypothetical protein
VCGLGVWGWFVEGCVWLVCSRIVCGVGCFVCCVGVCMIGVGVCMWCWWIVILL